MEVLHLIPCEEMTTVTSKNVCFFQFLGHNVPITLLKALRCKEKRNQALEHSFSLEVLYMPLCAELTKLGRKENFDTNPDPDPEWLLKCRYV